MRFSVTATSILGFVLGSSAAAVPTVFDNRGTDYWGLAARAPGLWNGLVPVILSQSAFGTSILILSNGTEPSPGETKLRFEFVEKISREGLEITAAKVLDSQFTVDVFMWQSFAAKYMAYSPFIEINGRAGSWGFEKDAYSDDMILSLNSTDTRAMVQWSASGSVFLLVFGSDIPQIQIDGGGYFDIQLVGVKY